jgi:hypothetical protein
MNFKEYWERNKVLLEPQGVTKEIAYKIWCDALDCFLLKSMEKLATS